MLIGAVLGAFVSIGALAQLANLAWGLWFTEIFVFLAIPAIALRQAGRSIWSVSFASRADFRSMVRGFVIGAINFFAWAMPLMYAAQKIFPKELVDSYDSASIFRDQGHIELAILVTGVSIAAPLCEEFFFRGAIFRGFATRFTAIRSIAISALIFSAFHFDPIGFLARFEMGLLFGFLAWRTQSLWPAVAAHAANNMTSTALFFVTQGEAVEGDLPWSVPLWMWIIGNAALIAAMKSNKSTFNMTDVIADAEVRIPPLWRIVRPWIAAAALAVISLIAVDFRGVRLNFFDALHPLSRSLRTEELQQMRQKARSGEIDAGQYRTLRERLSLEHSPSTHAVDR